MMNGPKLHAHMVDKHGTHTMCRMLFDSLRDTQTTIKKVYDLEPTAKPWEIAKQLARLRHHAYMAELSLMKDNHLTEEQISNMYAYYYDVIWEEVHGTKPPWVMDDGTTTTNKNKTK